MPRTLPGDENTLLHTHPHHSNRPFEKIDPGEENQESHSLRHDLRNGALYGSRTWVSPKNGTDRHDLTPGDRKSWALCRNNKKGKEWISHNDATTTQTTLAHLHQSQAYVLMYRKTNHSTGTETGAPITRASQQPTEKLKLSYKTHHSLKESLSHPDPPKIHTWRTSPVKEGQGRGHTPTPHLQ